MNEDQVEKARNGVQAALQKFENPADQRAAALVADLLGLDASGVANAESTAFAGPSLSGRRLDLAVEQIDKWQDELDNIAAECGVHLDTENDLEDGRAVVEVFDHGDLDRFTAIRDRIHAAVEACRAAGIEADRDPLGWTLEFEGHSHGRAYGELPGEYGFYPEHDRAAWLVYDEFGNPSYIATATFHEDSDDFTQSHWCYRESNFRDDGAVYPDDPERDIFDDDMMLMSDVSELAAYIDPIDRPRAEHIDYAKVEQIEERSQAAAFRMRELRSEQAPKPTSEALAAQGYTGPAAQSKHAQAASTVILDRAVASVRGNENEGYAIVTSTIPYGEEERDSALRSISEQTISPKGLTGDGLLNWQARYPDAYTVALRYAAGDLGEIPLFTGRELAEQAIEVAPSYAGVGSFLQGPAAVIQALGAAPMSNLQALEVFETFAHAQAASPSSQTLRCAEGVAKGYMAGLIINEARTRFDTTFEKEGAEEDDEKTHSQPVEANRVKAQQTLMERIPPVPLDPKYAAWDEVTVMSEDMVASAMMSTCGDNDEDDVLYVSVCDVEPDGSLSDPWTDTYVLAADDPEDVKEAWHAQFPNAYIAALLALKDGKVFQNAPQTVFGKDLLVGTALVAHGYCDFDMEQGLAVHFLEKPFAEAVVDHLDIKLEPGQTAEQFFAECAERAKSAGGGNERENAQDTNISVEDMTMDELMTEAKRYLVGQLSGSGSGRCPLGSFEACCDAIEHKAVKSCKDGAQAMEDLGKLRAQWKAAGLSCDGGSSQGALGVSEGAR